MSDSHTLAWDEQQLIRYLLGLLPEEEAERLDEATIVDDDVAARLHVVENDLVDAYVSGTLDAATVARFEAFYLSSPLRREKVKFARRFLGAIDRVEVARADAAGPARTPALRSTFPWSAAAAVFLVLAGGILLFEDVRLREGLTESRRQGSESERHREALAQQLEQARAANAETVEALEHARAALAARGAPANGRAQAAAGSPTLAPLALVLSPQTRAIGPLPTVDISNALDRIDVDLRLESNDFPRYRVALKDPGTGRMLWRSSAVSPRSRRDASIVSIAVPADVLASQHYLLEVVGLDAAGREEPVASYTFQVNRP